MRLCQEKVTPNLSVHVELSMANGVRYAATRHHFHRTRPDAIGHQHLWLGAFNFAETMGFWEQKPINKEWTNRQVQTKSNKYMKDPTDFLETTSQLIV